MIKVSKRALVSAMTGAALIAATTAAARADDGPASRRSDAPVAVLVQVAGAPSGVTFSAERRDGAARSVAGSAAAAQARTNAARQADVVDALRDGGFIEKELFRVSTAYNGVAVTAEPGDLGRIAELPGVRSVQRIAKLKPTNEHSVPYIKAPAAWARPGSLADTGQGVRIGIIDTGIDYVHTNFGGRGTTADYQAAKDAASNPAATGTGAVPAGFQVTSGGTPIYPSPKVVGGFDFVGDAYTGATTTPAKPDPNPLDCGGHGSHVAGTAGGYGVKADGTTFTGDYGSLDPASAGLKIGPGVAPNAQLYALRVFGCSGGTTYTLPAIDWALDPNRDGNPADHLDVVNMSLGSAFGSPGTSAETAAVQNSIDAGVAYAISAGNDGDVTGIAGSPGTTPGAVTVANATAGRHTDALAFSGASTLSVNGLQPITRSAAYAWSSAAPVVGTLYYPTTNQFGCSQWTGADAANIAGKVVVVRFSDAADEGTTYPCGSAARAANAVAAGAKGVLVTFRATTFPITLTGSSQIPVAGVANPLTTALLTELQQEGASSPVQVVFDNTHTTANTYVPDPLDVIEPSSSRGGGPSAKPDVSAPGTSINSTANGTGNGVSTLTGTSMASPHIAGMLALLRAAHPAWSVRELKALIMNTAGRDQYSTPDHSVKLSPQRAGAGMADVEAALADDVVAFADEPKGRVTVDFGPQVVTGTQTVDRTVNLVNKGATARTYTPSYDVRSTLPGVAYSFPDGASVTVPANGSATLRVRLTADASKLKNAHDPTLSETSGGAARDWLPETSGLVVLTDSDGPDLRVPTYGTVRPGGTVHADRTTLKPSGAAATVTATLTGDSVPPAATSTDFDPQAAPFELQIASPRLDDPAPAVADVRSVGVSSDSSGSIDANTYVRFAITTYGVRRTPTYQEAEFDLYVDTNQDGKDDYVIYAAPAWSSSSPADYARTLVYKVSSNSTSVSAKPVNGGLRRAASGTDTTIYEVRASAIGLSNASSTFSYGVRAYTGASNTAVDAPAPAAFDLNHPGLRFGSAYVPDQPGTTLPVTYDGVQLAKDGTDKMLLVHLLGSDATRNEIIPVREEAAPSANAGDKVAVGEGDGATLDGSGSSDANDDPLTYAWTVGSGAGAIALTGPKPTVTGSQLADAGADGPGIVPVHLAVSDGAHPAVEADTEIDVANVPPTIALTAPAASTKAGTPATVRTLTTDPSQADAAAGYAYAIDWDGDGSTDETVNGAGAADLTHVYANVGTYTVKVTAKDKDGGVSPVATASVAVSAAATSTPTATPGPIATGPVSSPTPLPTTTPFPPAPAAPKAKRVKVPRLKGRTLAKARAALKTAGLKVGRVKGPKRGKVRKQSPKAGKRVAPGTRVKVTLSRRR